MKFKTVSGFNVRKITCAGKLSLWSVSLERKIRYVILWDKCDVMAREYFKDYGQMEYDMSIYKNKTHAVVHFNIKRERYRLKD
ncbi:MAG: hypothetical protein FWB72_05930 [Firmicutes bacterium]|nr:hypothetical protein [Bacillota bacterium]